jgi:hypothetical protein
MRIDGIFHALLLIARPAAGKSEILAYLKSLTAETRRQRYHIGEMVELDDFPLLWAWFEEDALLEGMGKPRLHTDAQGTFLWQHLWDVLIERLGLEYTKKLRDLGAAAEETTFLVEFSRGAEHGGYRSAFAHLPAEMLKRAALLYVDVPWEESLRKNRKRFNPDKPDSILQHSLPDDKLERLYRETDWEAVRGSDPKSLTMQGIRVPYAVFANTDDVTSRGGEALGSRLEAVLADLYARYLQGG